MSEADRDLTVTALRRAVADYRGQFMQPPPFVPSEMPVPVSGKVFDHEELQLLVEASLDGRWTEGRFTQQAAAQLADFLGMRDVMLCNSGSSANLLALTAVTSALFGERRLRPGDEVIGVAAGVSPPPSLRPSRPAVCQCCSTSRPSSMQSIPPPLSQRVSKWSRLTTWRSRDSRRP